MSKLFSPQRHRDTEKNKNQQRLTNMGFDTLSPFSLCLCDSVVDKSLIEIDVH
jgi:hypothetical protein